MLNTKRIKALGLEKLPDGFFKVKDVEAIISIENNTRYSDILRKVYSQGKLSQENRKIRCLKNKHRNDICFLLVGCLITIIIITLIFVR